MRQVVSLSLVIACSGAWGYTILDRSEIQMMLPAWRTDPALGLKYCVQRKGGLDLQIHFVNTTTEERTFWFALDGYYDGDPASAPLKLPASASQSVTVRARRTDQWLYNAGLRLLDAPHDGAAAPRVDLTRALVPEAGFFVSTLEEDIDFSPRSLAYFVKKKEDGVAEVHFRNHGDQTIHFNFWIVGYQDFENTANPRMSVGIGEEIEFLLPLATMDARIGLATVELFDIRLGNDSGPLLSKRQASQAHHRLLREPDWSFIAMLEEEGTRFNPLAVVQRAHRENGNLARIEFKNLGTRAAHFDFWILNRQTHDAHGNPRVHVSPGSTAEAALPQLIPLGANEIVYVILRNVGLGDNAGYAVERRLPADGPATAENWLFAIPPEKSLFSSKGVGYAIQRKGADSAEIIFKNLSGVHVRFGFRIAGYQSADTKNPRVNLSAGERVTYSVNVTKSEARLAIAKVLLCDIEVVQRNAEPVKP